MQLEISEAQRELLVEGLRYVRSSRKLSFRDKFTNNYPNSAVELPEIIELLERLAKPGARVEVAK